MVDPTRQRKNVEHPVTQDPDKRGKVDAEKFKKVLKIEESTEAEKRRKRRTRKFEEEEEVLEKRGSPLSPPPNPNAFSELMEDKKQSNIFDPESPGVQRRAKSTAPAPMKSPMPDLYLDEEEGQEPMGRGEGSQTESRNPPFWNPPSPQTPPPSRKSDPPQLSQNRGQPEKSGAEKPNQSSNESSAPSHKKRATRQPQEKKPPSLPGREPLKSKKKIPSTLSPLIKILEADHQKKQTKGAKTKEEKSAPSILDQKVLEKKKAPFPAKKEQKVQSPKTNARSPSKDRSRSSPRIPKMELQESKNKISPPPSAPSKIDLRKLQSPPALKKKKREEKEPPRLIADKELPFFASLEESKGVKMDEKKGGFPLIDSEKMIATLPTSEMPVGEVSPPANSPAYSTLSAEVYELFEKMVGAIIVQDHSGITSTTLTLNMPHSIFDKAEVTLDRYQTAPNSFNLELKGSPEAVEKFALSLADLAAAFKQGEHAFEVNILRPSLIQKKPLIRRKGGAGGEGERQKK